MIRRPPVSVILLALAAFLCPLLGGQLANDVTTLAPGYAPTMQSLFAGVEIATAQHALLSLLIVAAFVYLIVKRKILQVPHPTISGPIAAFLVLLLASVLMSDYRWTSQTVLSEWIVYGIATAACVAGLGRKEGPAVLLGALSAGCGLTALIGIREYLAEFRDGNPSWRIFSTWNNPNALAGMLVIGVLVSLALVATSKERLTKLLAGLSAVSCFFAVFLTGSKGGLLALEIGLIALFFAAAIFSPNRRVMPALAPAAVSAAGFGIFSLKAMPIALGVAAIALAALGAVAFFGGQKSAVSAWAVCLTLALVFVGGVTMLSAGKGSSSRIAGAAQTQEQSSGFRIQLWKGAIALVKKNPVGDGVGTYAYYSAQPGTNTRTELAHSTWLQLAVEGGVLAPLALLTALIAWFVQTFRSSSKLPPERNLLRAGTMASVAAIAVHGVFESNLYFFGIGLTLFLLVGAGIQLSADAGAPEFVAPPIRWVAISFGVLCLAQLLYAGYVGKLQANLRWQVFSQNPQARETAAALRGLAPFDGETWYRSGYAAATFEEAAQDFAKAAEIAPNPKYYRRLAQIQESSGRPADAEANLKRALRYDKNNLQTLMQLMQLQDAQGNTDAAQQTARRIIAVEPTPYFQVSSLPDIIPTQTYQARIYLAKSGNAEQLLREAVDGLMHYADTTIPFAQHMSWGVAGITEREAKETLQMAADSAQKLATLYASKGDSAGQNWAKDALEKFRKTLEQLDQRPSERGSADNG